MKGASTMLDNETMLIMAYMYISKKNNKDGKPIYRWEGRIEKLEDFKKEAEGMLPGKDWLWPGVDGYALKYGKKTGTRTGKAWIETRIKKFLPWSLFLSSLYINRNNFFPLDNYVTECGEHIDRIESPEQLLSLKGKRLSRVRNQSNTPKREMKERKIQEVTDGSLYDRYFQRI